MLTSGGTATRLTCPDCQRDLIIPKAEAQAGVRCQCGKLLGGSGLAVPATPPLAAAQPEMVKCPNCGEETRLAPFCSFCNRPLPQAQAAPIPAPAIPAPPPRARAPVPPVNPAAGPAPAPPVRYPLRRPDGLQDVEVYEVHYGSVLKMAAFTSAFASLVAVTWAMLLAAPAHTAAENMGVGLIVLAVAWLALMLVNLLAAWALNIAASWGQGLMLAIRTTGNTVPAGNFRLRSVDPLRSTQVGALSGFLLGGLWLVVIEAHAMPELEPLLLQLSAGLEILVLIVGGTVLGAVSGALQALLYNLAAGRFGGVMCRFNA